MTGLLVTEIFPPRTGGSGRWFWEIYRRLPRECVAIAAGEDARQEQFDRTHDLRLVRMPLSMAEWSVRSLQGLRGYWRGVRGLLRLVRTQRIDMLHSGRCLPEGLMALVIKQWTGTPYLCFAHGEDVTGAATSRELSWLLRRVLNHAEFVIANSQNTRHILESEWQMPAGRIRQLHPGVDTTRFVPAARDARVREQLGWSGRPVVLTVGRLQKRKGHDQMIRALTSVRTRLPGVLYAIVGDGEERRPLQQLVAAERLADHVQFLGELDDESLVRCYQQCDLFVLPNRQVGRDIEGFGMVLLESQACGKPVVAGASGGTAETMCIPRTGRVVNCENPAALSDVVCELLADETLRDRMGAAARHWAADRFDWSALSRQAMATLGFDSASAGLAA